MREWIVTLHARSAVRLKADEAVNLVAGKASTVPVMAIRLHNAFANVDGKLIVTGLAAEAGGLAEEPGDAVGLLAPFAAPMLHLVATAANASVDEPGRLLVYAPPVAGARGRFVEQRHCSEASPAATIRSVGGAELLAMQSKLTGHSDEERLQRAMAHYRQAVRALDPFNRLMSAQHLWMASENLGQVVFRRLCREAGLPIAEDGRQMGENKHQLAVSAGFKPVGRSRQHLNDFDSHVRLDQVFDGDRETYRRLREASDAFEHGYGGFGDVQAKAHAAADTALRLVRRAILREIGLPAGSPLFQAKYEHPLEGWQPTFEMVGTYTSERDDEWPLFYGVNLFPEIVAIEELGDDQRNITFSVNGNGASLLEGQQLSIERHSIVVPLTPDRNVKHLDEPKFVITSQPRDT